MKRYSIQDLHDRKVAMFIPKGFDYTKELIDGIFDGVSDRLVYVVTKENVIVESIHTNNKHYYTDMMGSSKLDLQDADVFLEELRREKSWAPEPGDLIDVSSDSKVWLPAKFLGMNPVNSFYRCESRIKSSGHFSWKFARPIKETKKPSVDPFVEELPALKFGIPSREKESIDLESLQFSVKETGEVLDVISIFKMKNVLTYMTTDGSESIPLHKVNIETI